MGNLGRRIRQSIGMGLAWGAAWSAAGFVVARVPGFYSDLPFAFFFAPFGFAMGIIVSGILLLIEGRRKFDGIPLSPFAALGAVGGLVQAVVVATLRGEALGKDILVFGPVLALAGAVCGAGSLAAARRSQRAAQPNPSASSN